MLGKTASRRRLRLVLLLLGAALLVVVIGLHTGPVRDLVLRRALDAVPDRLAVRVGALEYRLYDLWFRLEDVSVAAAGQADAPFFTAEAVEVRLPWSVLLGERSLDGLLLVAPELDVRTREDGGTNLPAGGEPYREPLVVDRLEVRRMAIRWSRPADGLSLDIEGLGALLEPSGEAGIRGPLELERPAELRAGELRWPFRLDGTGAWDGRDVGVQPLRLRSEPVDVDLRGEVGPVLAEPRLDLAAEAEVRLGPLTDLLDGAGPAAGTLRVDAGLQGPAGAPRGDVAGHAEGLRWRDVETGPVTLGLRIEPDALVLEELSTSVGDAEIRADGEVSLADGDSRLELSWERLEPAAVAGELGMALPVELATSTSGRATLRWPGLQWRSARVQARTELRSLAAGPEAVPLAGTVRLEADADASSWSLDADLRGPGGAILGARLGGDLDPDAPGDGALTGSVALDVADLEPWRRLAARHTGAAAELPRLAGAMRLQGRVGGTLLAPSLHGGAGLRSLRVGDLPPLDADAELSVSPRRAAVRELRLTDGTNRLEGAVSLGLEDGALEGDLQLLVDDPEALLAALPDTAATAAPAPTVAGRLEGRLQLRGTLDAPAGSLTLEGRELTVGRWGPATLSAEISGDPGAGGPLLQLRTGRLETRSATLRLEGELEPSSGALRGNLAADVPDLTPWSDLLDLADLDVALSGALRGDLDVEGTLEAPRLEGELHGRDLGVAGIGPASVDVRLSTGADGAVVADVSASSPGPSLPRGTLPAVDARATVTVRRGDPAPRLEAELTEFRLASTPEPLILISPARVLHDGERLEVRDLELRVAESSLRLDGSLGTPDAPGVVVEVDARLADLDGLLAAALPGPAGEPTAGGEGGGDDPAAPRLEGRLQGRLTVGGELAAPTIGGTARLREGRVAVAGLPPLTDVAAELDATGDAIRLLEATAAWQGAFLRLRGRLPLAMLRGTLAVAPPARLTAELSSLTPEAIRPFLPAAVVGEIQGRLDLRADLEATAPRLEALRGEIRVDTLDLRLAGQPVRQEVPTTVELADGRLQVRQWSWLQGPADGASSRLTVSGSVGLARDAAVDLSLGGELSFQWLSAFLTGAALDGTAALDAHFGGTLDRPVLEGGILIRGGRYVQQEPRISVSELAGEVRLQGRHLVADALEGRVNGGRVLINLDIGLEEAGTPRGVVGVTVRNAALSLREIRAETNVDLTLRVQGVEEMRLFGSVTLLRGAYRSERAATRELLQLLGEEAAPGREASPLDRLRYDFRLTSAQPLRIDSPLAELALSVDLQVVGTRAEPALLGRVTLVEGGEVFLGGNTFLVETGGVDFSNPAAIDPVLDVTARTRVRDREIVLSITGPADAARVEFTSPDADLDEADILSLLVTGQTLEQVGTGDVGSLREQALGVLASQFVGTAGRAVGLEARIERGAPAQLFRPDPDLLSDDDDLASRLTLRKAITSDFTLIFSQNLGDSEQRTWVGRYELPWNLTAQGVKFDDDTLSGTLRHELVLGGPADVAGQAAARQRVEAVELRGRLGLLEAQVRGELDVEAGDRFDFWDWQEDAEALRRLYRERGLREATVRASREAVDGGDPTTAPRLRLLYDIDAGPETRLEVRGHPLPDDVRERLLAAWGDSIFIDFLLADMRQILRRHMAEQGYLRPEISVTSGQAGAGSGDAPPAREILVQVEPGHRVQERRLEFRGNERLETERLRGALASRDLQVVAWIEPGEAAAALRAVYEAAGMPDTTVTIGEPEISGDRARLVVRIDEGPVQRVQRVDLRGNEAVDREALQEALSVATAGPWSPGRLASTRSAVAGVYRGRGYNEVDVDGRVADDPEGLTLTLTVAEGPRQILREVEVLGAEITDDAVIDRALKALVVGEPLVLSQAYDARRRLFDTGVFRSVRLDIQETGPQESGTQAMRARFTVVEEPRFRIESGFEVLDEEVEDGTREQKPGISVNVTHDNFLGRAVSLGASGRLRSDQKLARFYVTTPRLLGLPLRSTVTLSRFNEQIGPADDPFRIDRTVTQTTAEQRLPFWRHWVLSYSANWQRNETFFPNADPDDPFSPEGDAIDIVRLRSSVIRDTRDDQLAARSGSFHASTVEWAAPSLGSDAQFTKYLAHQYFYWPVAEDVVLASAVRFGTAHDFGEELIAFERFRVGGSTTVRGYPDDSLGSLQTGAGRVPGGNSMLILNQELRFPVWRWLRGVTFVDAGSAFAGPGDIRPSALSYSTGVGLRLQTPFVMFRLDWGIRLGDVEGPLVDGDPSRARFHFGIGHVF